MAHWHVDRFIGPKDIRDVRRPMSSPMAEVGRGRMVWSLQKSIERRSPADEEMVAGRGGMP